MVVLCEGNDIPLACDLEATASWNLDVRALKLADQTAVTLEYSHMETVAVWISDQDVTRIWDVNSIREVSDVLTSYTSQELAFFIKYHNAVTL